jgi:hypothetical protein
MRPLTRKAALFALSALALTASAQTRFEAVGAIHFPGDTFLAGIRSLEVAPNGDLLLVDRGARAILFDSTGTLLMELDAAACHPGFSMSPFGAWFGPDFILMANSGPWGYTFTRTGECGAAVDESYRPSLRTAISETGTVYTFRMSGGTQAELIRAKRLGKPIAQSSLADLPFPQANRRFEGGGLVVIGDSVYLALSATPDIYLLDGEGVEISRWRVDPVDYRALTRDAPARVTDIQDMGRLYMSYTPTDVFDRLTPNRLIQIFAPRGEGGVSWNVYDLTGKAIAREKGLGFGFLAFRAGIGYQAVYPEDGDPYLRKWRYVEGR